MKGEVSVINTAQSINAVIVTNTVGRTGSQRRNGPTARQVLRTVEM